MQIFSFYLDKLNENQIDLWQRAKQKVKNEDPVWYDNAPLGRDTLNNIMKDLFNLAGLSQIYRNHSIRSTAITKLDENDIKARHIQAISSHKCESSLKTYSKRCPTAKKCQMFDILAMDKSSQIVPVHHQPLKFAKTAPTSTISKPQADDQNANLKNIDILDFVPIDNNSNDFDLNEIIKTVDQQQTTSDINNDTQMPVALMTPQINVKENTGQNPVALTTPQNQTVSFENPPVPAPQMSSNVNFNTTNSTNMQNQPFIPSMIFPHSNVTINYNFQK